MKYKLIFAFIILAFFAAFFLTESKKVEAPIVTSTPTPTSSEVDDSVEVIRVDAPFADDVITSPFVVKGQARGTWFFEASFPVSLVDENGKVIVGTHAQAKSDWMTTDFVPFEATLTFSKPTTATGKIILKKDNPSALPEYDASISIPVRFK